MARKLLVAAAIATAIGVVALVLQRWVAETRDAAIALVGAWYAVFGLGLIAWLRRNSDLRLTAAGTFAAVVIASGVIGYWTGFRDQRVDEDVVVAAQAATGAELAAGLSGQVPMGEGEAPAATSEGETETTATEPVELAAAPVIGADGHAAEGTAKLIRRPDGTRVLTLNEFSADPGVDVNVYLSVSADGLEDEIDLGDLKGNVGDQQYEIPADADLGTHSSLVIWCKPFTVRIAIAEFGV